MKFIKTLTLGLCILGLRLVDASDFTALYSFTNVNDGFDLRCTLVLSSNTLYGTTYDGGENGNGSVFKVNTDGTGFTNLYSFTAYNFPITTNSDGANPEAGLILSSNTLFGTASNGGTNGNGTVFKVNTDGMGFTTLHSFTNGNDGANPQAGLTLSGNTLYGTASVGGTNENGTVFKVNIDGTDFTTLYNFTNGNDGAYPEAGLILSSNTLFGTASNGGTNGNGTVFKINTNGTNFTTLYTFSTQNYDYSIGNYTNSDGVHPGAGLILSGNTLYGTAYQGGTGGNGTVFKLNTDGTGFTLLHTFSSINVNNYTNSDGAGPGDLILSNYTLYGIAGSGGAHSSGAVFKINTDNTNFTTLYTFTGGNDGANAWPGVGLTLSGNTLYGTAEFGGSSGNGTVFALNLSFPIPLNIQSISNAVILSWTNSAFALQSAPLITGTYTTISNATSPYTNVISGSQQFFQLLNTNSP
jgi:uncharacterized repeat protein (TIGR03803 family)